LVGLILMAGLVPLFLDRPTPAAEPDPSTYWKVSEIRVGMKGTGRTVMVGTQLEDFEAEVLGVMRDVSPGRDMILCRLKGCNLEHAGIIQGMSGSPIHVDGKLLGAVAFAWEFAKDPIAGVTPFEQMVQYVRSTEKRVAAEAGTARSGVRSSVSLIAPADPAEPLDPPRPMAASLGGMRPIATPLAASGFSPRALAFLSDQLTPMGLAPVASGLAPDEIVQREGDKPLVPGSPLSVAFVLGDFDLSGIGTVTHVEGNRVYGFGHPMFGLGACQFPMMSGYIHTVYPRASVSMKMGSPLKVVGVLDADVSTGIAGRLGAQPDLIPMEVRVQVGGFSEPNTYKVQIVREPNLLPSLVMSVLTNSIDTEGNLPEELTARIQATIRCQGHEPIVVEDAYSGARYTGPSGPSALFSEIGKLVNILARNPLAPVRIESIDARVEIQAGRITADVESIRLASDRVEPGQTLQAFVTLKPFQGERRTLSLALPLPDDLPEGAYEASVCDQGNSLRRRLRNNPELLEPKDLKDLIGFLRYQFQPRRTHLYLHVPLPDKGLAVQGQALPNLPGSVRAVLSSTRQTPQPALRADLIEPLATPYVVEGTQTIKFTVIRDANLALSAGSE
jgi:hypothetical protein